MPGATPDFGSPLVAGKQIDLARVMTGTDVLTVRSALQDQAVPATDMPTSTEPIDVKVPSPGPGFGLTDLEIIPD